MKKLNLTNLDKVFWPDEGITKRDLLEYYQTIAPYILPYLKDRPVSLKRFPDGITGKSFFQKNLRNYPDWIKTANIPHGDKTIHYLLVQNAESLLYAVNLGCIELHPFFSRTQSLESPDFLAFDLDPIDIPFSEVAKTALVLHEILETIDAPNFIKTSGARGLHICVPLKKGYSFDQAKHFAELIALLAHKELPTITSLERLPQKRLQRVYIDCLQNNPHQTLVAPYCIRAKPKATASTPLEWSEVKSGLDPTDFTLQTTPARLKKVGDLFEPLLQKGLNLEKALNLLKIS